MYIDFWKSIRVYVPVYSAISVSKSLCYYPKQYQYLLHTQIRFPYIILLTSTDQYFSISGV